MGLVSQTGCESWIGIDVLTIEVAVGYRRFGTPPPGVFTYLEVKDYEKMVTAFSCSYRFPRWFPASLTDQA